MVCAYVAMLIMLYVGVLHDTFMELALSIHLYVGFGAWTPVVRLQHLYPLHSPASPVPY